jgi:hypothetical protein
VEVEQVCWGWVLAGRVGCAWDVHAAPLGRPSGIRG